MQSAITHTKTLFPFPSLYRSWFLLSVCITFSLSLPLMTILYSIFFLDIDIWQHLYDTVLLDYVSQSFQLLLGVSIFSVLIGVTNAWIVAVCEFPGRRIIQWGLLLPMAMPAYIVAYTYTGVFDAAGPIQQGLRTLLDLQYGEYWFPDIRSMGGAIMVLSLVLYPYVYLLARAAFQEQSSSFIEVSRTLGCSIRQTFFRVGLKLARPSIVVGWSLVMMETLADYGTVQYFGLSTFTVGIFRTWFGIGNHMAAAQLSILLLMFVFLALFIEKAGRRDARYYHSGQSRISNQTIQLNFLQSGFALLVTVLPIVLGFLLPVYFLMNWALLSYQDVINNEYWRIIFNSFYLAGLTSLLAVVIALLLAYSHRLLKHRFIDSLIRITGLGYAIPGTVIAVGVLLPLSWLDRKINLFWESFLGSAPGLLLTGTVFILFFAYLVRFMSISLNSSLSVLEQIKPSMDESARLQGTTGKKLIGKIYLPLMKTSLISAALLVFVDVLKELPATLILRPFNFNTLAVRAYELANEERLVDAAVPSLTIVLVGLIPVILLSHSMSRSIEKYNE